MLELGNEHGGRFSARISARNPANIEWGLLTVVAALSVGDIRRSLQTLAHTSVQARRGERSRKMLRRLAADRPGGFEYSFARRVYGLVSV